MFNNEFYGSLSRIKRKAKYFTNDVIRKLLVLK